MITTEKINFRQTRDIGQVYNTTFRFIRQNKDVLFKSITYYIMPFILVAAFLLFNGFSDLILLGISGLTGNFINLGFLLVKLFVGAVLGYLAYTAYVTLIYEYMRLYHEATDPDTITHQQVWKATRQRFLIGLANVLVWGIVNGIVTFAFMMVFNILILMIVGVATFIFTSTYITIGIYIVLYIAYYAVLFYIQAVTSPMIFISAFDKVNIFTAFGRGFSMVNRKYNVWNAIGTMILGTLILWILHGNMVSLPVGIAAGIFEYNGLTASSFLSTKSIWFTIIFKVIFPLFTILYFYTLVIYFVSQAFETLNLSERTEGRGLLEKINKLGTQKDIGPEFYDVTY